MKVLSNKRYEKATSGYYNQGFHDAINSVIAVLEAKEQIVIGNGAAFVGASINAPLTMVGNSAKVMNSLLTMDPKWKKAGHKNNITIRGKIDSFGAATRLTSRLK